MKTVILGKKIENYYEVNHHWKDVEDGKGGLITVYADKPTIIKTPKIKEWAEICSYDGVPRYNSDKRYAFVSYNNYQINISEDETVTVSEEIFRADLNEMHLRTNKVLEEIDIDKENAEIILSEQIHAFNAAMITSNEKLKSYCDIHKLSYEDTDVIELFAIVFPGEKYEIVDGVMKVKEYLEVCCSSVCNSWVNTNTATITGAIGTYK